jgi:hypothetical protein
MIAAAASGVLIVSMLFPWFSIDTDSASGFDLDGNAWEALGFIDVAVFFAAIAVIGLVVVKAAEPALLKELPWPPANVALTAGAVATVLILFRVISPPELDFGDFTGFDFDTNREFGLFLGLAAALGMLAGGWLQLRESAPAAPAAAATTTAPPPDDLTGS